MRKLVLFPFWAAAIIALAVVGALLFVVALVFCVVDFLINGHAPTQAQEAPCHVCGLPYVPAPTHRWQVVQYVAWMLQHTHSFRDTGVGSIQTATATIEQRTGPA